MARRDEWAAHFMICRENNLPDMGLITLKLPVTTLHIIHRKARSLTSD